MISIQVFASMNLCKILIKGNSNKNEYLELTLPVSFEQGSFVEKLVVTVKFVSFHRNLKITFYIKL